MSAVALADAFLALLPDDVTVHDGQVTSTAPGVAPALPWVYSTIRIPEVAERAMNRQPQLRTVRGRFLVYAATAAGVRIVADLVDAALEGAVPDADGWKCSAVEQVNTREPVEDVSLTLPESNRHPMFAVLEYLFTASPTT